MITIYGHSRCSWCISAKKLAEANNLQYEWKDTDDQEVLNELKIRFPSVRTVPQIWWGDHYIGGFEALSATIEELDAPENESK